MSKKETQKDIELCEGCSFARLLGIKVGKASNGTSRLLLPFKENLTNRAGFMQGGVIASFADCACGIALRTLQSSGETAATADLDIKYLAPAKGGLEADAKIIHKGSSTAVGDVEIRDVEGSLIAKATETFAVLRPE